MRLAVIYGTRPEAVKLAPLIPLLDHPVVICSGQHTDLLAGTPAEGVPEAGKAESDRRP